MTKRNRNVQLHFRVDTKEREIIEQKMKLLGTENINAYLRRMAVYGYMIEVDMQPLNSLTTELSRIGNNINQLTKRANQTNNIYLEDIERIAQDVQDIKGYLKDFIGDLT